MHFTITTGFEEVEISAMRTALIAAILFAALLNCAYSAPQPKPDVDTEAVLQELQSVQEQGGSSTPAPTQYLCTKSGSAEAQFLGIDDNKYTDVQQARDQWLNRKNVGKALKVANAVHRAWNDQQIADAQANRYTDVQQARDQWLNRKNVGKALKIANAAHRAWNNRQLADAQGSKYTDVQQARDQWLNRKNVGKALKIANAAHRAWNNRQLADAQGNKYTDVQQARDQWLNQQLADAQGADQEFADAQGAAPIVNFSCTPVKINSNGEVTFLDLE